MIAANPLPLVTRVQFLHASRVAGLLSDTQFACVERNLSPDLPAADTARALVAAGFLTPFQADRLLAGKTDGFVLGQYVIREQIADGVSSRLYQARHRTMNRLVAIKVLAAQLTRDPVQRAAFQAAARAAAKLTHPNIVTVLDVNRLGERVYLVLDYVEGASLAAFVQLRGPVGVTRACELIRQAALGLQHAHDQGLIHGQLHPGVLLVGHPGGVRGEKTILKVAGFERSAEDPGDANPADYRAPELAASEATPTVEADLYSLGAVLHFLLTGSPPGAAAPPEIPSAIAGLLAALLAEAPADRPLSAMEVAERLEPFAESGEALGRVDFDVAASGLSPASGFLSGLHAAPSSRRLELDDTSPWAGLENGTVDEATEATCDVWRPALTKRPRRTALVLGLSILAIALGVTALALLGR